MRTLSAAELLSVWERGRSERPAQRALTLLAAACADTPTEELRRLTVGERDRRLLTLREWAFGSCLQSLADCPACGEKLEVECSISDVRVAHAPELLEEFPITAAEHEVRFRLPNAGEVACLSADAEVSSNQIRLLERCVLSAHRYDGQVVPADRLPTEVVTAVTDRMAQIDPQADVQLALTCPACQHRWLAAFDIVSFFWNEITAWSRRLLREVHMLASAYGWSEAEILSLSPWRRQAYLEMVGG